MFGDAHNVFIHVESFVFRATTAHLEYRFHLVVVVTYLTILMTSCDLTMVSFLGAESPPSITSIKNYFNLLQYTTIIILIMEPLLKRFANFGKGPSIKQRLYDFSVEKTLKIYERWVLP